MIVQGVEKQKKKQKKIKMNKRKKGVNFFFWDGGEKGQKLGLKKDGGKENENLTESTIFF